MKNKFTVEVSLNSIPIEPFEWTSISLITGLKAIRIEEKTLKDILTYHTTLNYKSTILLLTDTKTSIVVKTDDKGLITRYSYLMFEKDLDVCEYSKSLNIEKIEYTKHSKKLKYKTTLIEEEQIKDYILKSIKSSKDENKSKYLYYLYFNEIENYSKEKLMTTIKNDEIGNYKKIYDFLTML